METVLNYIGLFLLIGGSFLIFTSAVGLFRLQDIFTRMHAASIADGFGAFLVLLGIGVMSGSWIVAVKLALLALFLLVTGPTACHALIQAALKDTDLPKKPPMKPGKDNG